MAEEAARLVQSLSRWAGGDEAQRAPAGGQRPGAETGPDTDGATAGCTCSCHRAGEAAACRLCPVCQGIAMLRSIRPETLERVADVAGMAATALHELAEQRRQAAAQPTAAQPTDAHRTDARAADEQPAGEQQSGGESSEDPAPRHESGEEDPS